MRAAVKVGLVLSGGLPPSYVTRVAVAAEEAGLDSVWITEGLGGDAFAVLGHAAAATTSIRVGTAVVNTYTRSPGLLAMSAVTLAELSAGRFVLGLGVGHAEHLAAQYDVRLERPLARVADAVELVRRLQRDGRVEDAGLRTVTISRLELRFDPAPVELPVYMAAVGPRMLELAGRIADGVMLVWRTPEDVAAARDAVRDGCALTTMIHCGVGDTAAEAEAAIDRVRSGRVELAVYRRLFAGQQRLAGIACPDGASLRASLDAYRDAGLDEAILQAVPGTDRTAYDAAIRLVSMAADYVSAG